MKILMNAVKAAVQSFANDDEGTVAMEYGLVGAVVSVAAVNLVGTISATGGPLSDMVAAFAAALAAVTA